MRDEGGQGNNNNDGELEGHYDERRKREGQASSYFTIIGTALADDEMNKQTWTSRDKEGDGTRDRRRDRQTDRHKDRWGDEQIYKVTEILYLRKYPLFLPFLLFVFIY